MKIIIDIIESGKSLENKINSYLRKTNSKTAAKALAEYAFPHDKYYFQNQINVSTESAKRDSFARIIFPWYHQAKTTDDVSSTYPVTI